MRSNAYTNCYEFMFVFSKEKVYTFNPLKIKTVRYVIEKFVANKKTEIEWKKSSVNRKKCLILLKN